jgi:hypothetical protein
VVPDAAQALGLAEEPRPDYLTGRGQADQPDRSTADVQRRRSPACHALRGLLYEFGATFASKTPLPKSDMRTSKLIDGVVWDGKDPAKYADSFKVKA